MRLSGRSHSVNNELRLTFTLCLGVGQLVDMVFEACQEGSHL